MFNNLIDSLDDSLNIKLPIMLRQINIPSSNIFVLEDHINSFKKHKKFLCDRPQKQ